MRTPHSIPWYTIPYRAPTKLGLKVSIFPSLGHVVRVPRADGCGDGGSQHHLHRRQENVVAWRRVAGCCGNLLWSAVSGGTACTPPRVLFSFGPCGGVMRNDHHPTPCPLGCLNAPSGAVLLPSCRSSVCLSRESLQFGDGMRVFPGWGMVREGVEVGMGLGLACSSCPMSMSNPWSARGFTARGLLFCWLLPQLPCAFGAFCVIRVHASDGRRRTFLSCVW